MAFVIFMWSEQSVKMGKGYICMTLASLLMTGPKGLLVNWCRVKKSNKVDADQAGLSGAGGFGEFLAAIKVLGS